MNRDNLGRFIKGAIPPNTAFKKGHKTWNKGLKGYMAGDKHWSFGKRRNDLLSENHPNWKGDKASYSAIHHWLKSHLGKPKYCSVDLTHKSTRYVWANISGEYKREVSDYRQLCTKCNLNDGISIHIRFRRLL